jgi:murein DD-endopeptidase MepM/ murein hydrolase activator NlpD
VVLDQSRPRGASRRHAAESIDLGNEPPLSVDGGSSALVDRRRLSVQWFSGTILTGLIGAALMGGAVFTSLDGETNFTAAPERVEPLRGALTAPDDRGAHKTDRLPPISEASIARRTLRVPTTTRSRDREVVRMHPYTRVSGNLSLTVSDLSANIPPFNPQKLLADAVAGDDQAAAPEPDAEVSFVTCDFVPVLTRARVTPAACDINGLVPKVKASMLLPLDEVMARVRDVANAARTGTPFVASAAGAPALRLNYAPDVEPDAYFGFEARAVPMNVTLLPKTTIQPTDWSERLVTAKKGDTVGSILRELGAVPDEIKQIIALLGPIAHEGGLKEGQKLRVLMGATGIGHMKPLRVIVVGDSAIEAAVAFSDTGRYVPIDIRNVDTDVAEASGDTPASDEGSGVPLYQSLYETALRNNIPGAVVAQIVKIYAYDVDFQRKVQPGDSFDVLFADDTNGDGSNEVRYAALTIGGDTKKYYHFQTTDDATYDYYDETGKSSKKFLVRKPVANGAETSPFGWRTHPIAHIKEFHSGVDWAAPTGTPIFAAGNGTIEEIGLRGGYGKYVRIKHADGYETAYGHMSAFARGLQIGSKVRQGQVIGFVGSTGLSTGSHVHFEILINDRFVNPMTVKLPRGRVLDGVTLTQFEKDRSQLDALMAAHIAQASH